MALLFMGISNSTGAEFSNLETNKLGVYAGSESCRDCHQTDYDLWSHSHHALAERPVDAKLDQAAFAPTQTILHAGQTNAIRIQNGEYQIVTLGLESNMQPFHVERVIGREPLIQFITPFPGGRYQVHEASYDIVSNQWFYVYGDDIRNPGEYGHWTGRGMNWNSQCAECHNTGFRKNYDAATDSYHSTLAEMGVGCEACHGPLKSHVEWQYAHPKSTTPDPTISHLQPSRIVGMCGSCHSRTTDLTDHFEVGASFYDQYWLDILDSSEEWYPDGQIKDEDYEFVSFISSKMYQAGVTCLDCHNPHSAKNSFTGNQLCMRCHGGGFPKAPVINIAQHTHHELTDHGSDCIGCHMPVTVYMQRQPRHDHGFTIPDPLLTKELNIPNACNRCHDKQTTDWAINYTKQWYGTNMDRSTRNRARWIAAAQSGDQRVENHMIGLLEETNQGPYWQAVAAGALGQWSDTQAVQDALLKGLKNKHPLIREQSVRALESSINDTNIRAALQPLLHDPTRNVRIAVAWTLRASLDLQTRGSFDLQHMFALEDDQPVAQFQWANFLLARQQPAEALNHLEKATLWDPISPPFQCAHAEVLDQLGQTDKAITILKQEEQALPQSQEASNVLAKILERHNRDHAPTGNAQ